MSQKLVQRGIQEHVSYQKINKEGRIQVSKKAWLIRLSLISVVGVIVIYNIELALYLNSPVLLYANILPIHALLYILTGWLFFKNKANGKVGNELVSVIIPIYNQKLMIETVIEAIYKSIYKNIEVIAVNDGSRDGTKEILDNLSKTFPSLKIIHKKNEGKRIAVATGFYESKGSIILLVDSDSVIDENAIVEFLKTFNSDPKIGAVVGFAKPWNANTNLLTKIQDAWYDFSFNIRKTAESALNCVTCCSGCLAAYRREAIQEYIPYWESSEIHISDDRELTTYAIANPSAKKQLSKNYLKSNKLSINLLESMAKYDDAEDRGLTGQSLVNWKSVYVPSAIVWTEVPTKLKGFYKQQFRWKKGTLRVNFFCSSFFWRKHPIFSTIFYVDFMMPFVTPFIIIAAMLYVPIVHNEWWAPVVYLLSMQLIAITHGIDYKLRDKHAKTWYLKPIMNLLMIFVFSWIIFPAFMTYRKNQWMTR